MVGGGEHDAALLVDLGGGVVMDVGGGVEAQATVMMIVVVPGEERLAVLPGGRDRGEVAGEIRDGISSFELSLAVGVVVADVRAVVGLGDA